MFCIVCVMDCDISLSSVFSVVKNLKIADLLVSLAAF